MKKYISFTALILTVLLFSACIKEKKTYTCVCEGGLAGGATFSIEAKSKKSADNTCASYNGNVAADGYFNCHIE